MEEWMNFYQKLSKVNNFKIPRGILLTATIRIEIHGFSDASERAYAAVVYIKCFNESGQSQTRLLCSKSRVAPLKTLTIPRLELSAALLLSRLVKKVVPILQLPIHKIWMWTDSTIALAWIKTKPHKLKTFVSNRVAEIQALSKDYHWKHVSSKNNPADLISRGCNVDELLKNEMWFSGPDLQTDEYEENQLFPDPSYRDELKCAVTLSMTEFINNIKAKESCNKEKYLTADEIKRSTEFLAKIAQLSEFKAEIDALKKGKGVSKTSKLKALDPFLDENSLLGVGGRLSNADLPFEAKHQIIIPTLKRLCARRGRISTLMSDNATNFKGAAAELNRFIKLICNKNETLANYFTSEAIQWKFIPPRSPNFGGLWEAGQRNKWQFEKNNVAVGCLVLLKENNLPPCKWAMARILEVIYGTDGKSAYFYDCERYYGSSWSWKIQQKNFGAVFRKRKSKCGRKRKTTPRTDKFLVHNSTMHPYKTSKDLQRELLAIGMSVDSPTIQRRLIEAEKFARKPIEKQLLTPTMKKNVSIGSGNISA
ncbi:integrase catalytic domain-containing protein [Trichonephila clavipes]|nr:integrase catalytic domain-containing protein [Trichonephila clavipes]